MTRHPLAALVLGLVAVVSACSGGDDARDATARPPTGAEGTSTANTADTDSDQPVVDSPDDVAPATSATALATTLTTVERALRSPTTPADTVAALGWEQQVAYRTLSNNPEWEPTVLAALPPDVHPVVASIVEAGRSLTTLVEPQEALPDWRIEAPPPPELLIDYYREAEVASGVPWQYLAAIHFVETRMGRIRGTSTAGAQGPMQFIPATWDAYGEGDINDNRDAILAAGRYLDARGAPDDMTSALYAYNNSDDYVDSILRYADLVAAGQELVYRGFYHWQVYYATTRGVALLPEGFPGVPAVYLTTR